MTDPAGILKSIAKGVGIIPGESQQKQPELFSHYVISLQSLWLGLKKTDAEIKADPILTRIAGLMTACEKPVADWEENWRNAWQAEQLMSGCLDGTELIAEAEKKLFDADRIKMPSAAYFAEKWKSASAIGDAAAKAKMQSALYGDVLDDLHWHYGKRSLDRKIRTQLAGTVRRLAFYLIFFAILPFVPLPGGGSLGGWLFAAAADAPRSHLYGLYTAATFGLLGALFSRLIYMQTNYAKLEYDDLVNIFQNRAISIRLLVGMIGAIIVFYAILGNFLSGDLFPRLADLKLEPLKAPDPHFAKLVIWCFLGGFSERLVPDFLARTEASASKTS